MNTLGIICAVAIPSMLFGASIAAWVIRSPLAECVQCGTLATNHLAVCAGECYPNGRPGR